VSAAHVPLETAFQMVDAVQVVHQRDMMKLAAFSVVTTVIVGVFLTMYFTRGETSSTPTSANTPAPANTYRPQDRNPQYLA
jgi:hypothetical protein